MKWTERPDAANGRDPAPAAGRVAGATVILVEDDLDIGEMYRLGLEQAGFGVMLVSDGSRALEALAITIPDLLVLDWELPGMKGDELLVEVRRLPHAAFLPVFMLSNYPSTSDGVIDRVFQAGALAWLEKRNTTPAMLAERLREALHMKARGLPAY